MRDALQCLFPVLTLSLILVACGGGGSSGGTNAGDSPSLVATTSGEGGLAVSVKGIGTITSSPGGIACGNVCSASFAQGAAVTLTATPAVGYTFTGWSGACSGTAGCSVTSPAGATVEATFTASAASATALAIHASGGHLMDGHGNPIQLRGVNVSGLEFVAVQGWDPDNPWGGVTGSQPDGTETPPWKLIATTWGANAVRLPLNEASWLGLHCNDVGGAGKTVVNGTASQNAPGTDVSADPGGNYKRTVIQSVADAMAAKLYVILDLHWAAPGSDCPFGQNPFADADHSIAFWTSVAGTFMNDPGVIFEAFNEPFPSFLTSSADYWSLWKMGGTFGQFLAFGSSPLYQIDLTWQATSMQQMVTAIRSAGASNVVLISGESWSGDLSEWLTNVPADTLSPSQIGAVWHAYPGYNASVGTAAYLEPNNAVGDVWTEVQGIIDAGYPVVITEFGDQTASASAGAPFAAKLLPWADINGVSYLGWSWDIWQNPSNVLITDAAGDPTPGFGEYTQTHYLCRAAGSAQCP